MPRGRYDNNGTNFALALREGGASSGNDPASGAGQQLPKGLCDKWAWAQWDSAGRPNRSQADAQADYDAGVKVCVGVGATRWWW